MMPLFLGLWQAPPPTQPVPLPPQSMNGLPQVVVAYDSAWQVEEGRVQKLLTEVAHRVWRKVGHGAGPVLVLEPLNGPRTEPLPSDNAYDYWVRLDVDGPRWRRMMAQFGRQVCFVALGATDPDWFDEAVCREVALWEVVGMGLDWHFDGVETIYGLKPVEFVLFASRGLFRGPPLPDRHLPGWFSRHEARLQQQAKGPKRAALVGRTLSPILGHSLWEGEPLRALRTLPPAAGHRTLAARLEAWWVAAPPHQQPIIEEVAQLFGVDLWSEHTCAVVTVDHRPSLFYLPRQCQPPQRATIRPAP